MDSNISPYKGGEAIEEIAVAESTNDCGLSPNSRPILLSGEADSMPEEITLASHLLFLPSEIQLALFDHFDAVSSTCLGLTCKHFYNLHIAKWGLKVPLFRRSDHETAVRPHPTRPPPRHARKTWIEVLKFNDPENVKFLLMDRVYLCGCLREWMEPQYLYSLKLHKYIKKENYEDYQEGQGAQIWAGYLEGVIEWLPLGSTTFFSRTGFWLHEC